MKKFIMGSIVSISLLFAESNTTTSEYTQAQRIMDMQKMAQAMQDIQSGFFYNNIDIVKKGVDQLKGTIVNVGPTLAEITSKDIYEQYMQNGEKITRKIKKKIERRAQDVIEHFKNGDAVQALQSYSKISKECMKCHVRLRKW